MICLYIGAGCVVYSIFTIEHPKGPEYTIPISPTMQCVLNLTFQFFFVYIWIWAAITVKEFTRGYAPAAENSRHRGRVQLLIFVRGTGGVGRRRSASAGRASLAGLRP